MSKRIALIEDDEAILDNYRAALEHKGFNVVTFTDRLSATQELSKSVPESLPDLAIIDIGLKHEIDGGFTLCQHLRSLSPTLPIIFFTARDSDIDSVCGLRMGADDYLTKDISMHLLFARIAALFRRSDLLNEPVQTDDIITQGNLSIDAKRMIVTWRGCAIDLTVTEFWMLHAIARYTGHVKSRQQLMDESKMVVDDTTIKSHIKRIRKKFMKADPNFNAIETVYGMGYRWKDDSPATSH